MLGIIEEDFQCSRLRLVAADARLSQYYAQHYLRPYPPTHNKTQIAPDNPSLRLVWSLFGVGDVGLGVVLGSMKSGAHAEPGTDTDAFQHGLLDATIPIRTQVRVYS